ncbi:TetR family transcriptional regulator [Gordonia desulfuricans]|uniref:TetR family transcriptional regulator n=1 Tax=Gordonia desulfuricans TaxID=89051 RepID=A0A7K3LP96_9ACTN|nr:TetR family transcriptional regulator [Gordonia desulfuricans]NDK90059.1 TetR family transcriptional regulator [Gordonia desulfuricans]
MGSGEGEVDGGDPVDQGDRGGRPALTNAHALAACAQELFLRDGFEQTTVADIARAAGVSSRTFFRYFPAKADVVWVESDAEIAVFRTVLDAAAGDAATGGVAAGGVDAWRVIADGFAASLDHGDAQETWARHRAELILREPAVQAQATVIYAQWRATIAEFVATCLRIEPSSAPVVAIAYAGIAASRGAHELWLAQTGMPLSDCIFRMFELMRPAISTTIETR